MRNSKESIDLKKSRSTGIEWTDHTWNPFIGCSIKSAGCHNCYAMALASRLESMGQSAYKGMTKNVSGKTIWTGEVRLNTDSALNKPNTVRPGSIFFVNSMSDFFHENATDDMRLRALDIMREVSRHQYQVLTKRPENIMTFLKRTGIKLPDNVWIGATVEGSNAVDRIDLIKKIPARIKFLSIEPLISDLGEVNLSGIDWVISGGESGPNSRPMKADWLRNVRDLSIKYKVRHFFKQWGIPENNPLYSEAPEGVSPSSWVYRNDPIGKGGSKLDGVYIKQMPEDFKVSEYKQELLDIK